MLAASSAHQTRLEHIAVEMLPRLEIILGVAVGILLAHFAATISRRQRTHSHAQKTIAPKLCK
jgi:hypothetical protein